MKVNKYPINLIGYFIGDILKMPQYKSYIDMYLGVYKVKVTSPKDIKHPLLPYKINESTVYGTGTWEGRYYSEELKNAAKFGSQYEILAGYLFEGQDIFSNYVKTLSKMKEDSTKGTPMYLICKLLLNALYGRYGMDFENKSHQILDQKQLSELIDNVGEWNIDETIDIDDKTLVSTKEYKPYKSPQVNMAIALAVTANARIYMSRVKNNPDIKLFYTDTDSAFTGKPLPDEWYHPNKTGYFKLENVVDNFVALGPKVYGAIKEDGSSFTKVKGFKGIIPLRTLTEALDSRNP
uniref:hypothetical protein n=1 Tax=Porodaedalea niemelaei TaxID=175858 RepID=UPI0023AA4A16|nr:hypothetical protein P1R16_mgp08 [Porodaedalea niemelaei]WCF76684.1 hypothetical protein [Porodaedalea niemelaei]